MIENIKDYENGIEKLKKILEKLDKKDMPIHESIGYYQDGMELIKEMKMVLNQEEIKLEILNGTAEEKEILLSEIRSKKE